MTTAQKHDDDIEATLQRAAGYLARRGSEYLEHPVPTGVSDVASPSRRRRVFVATSVAGVMALAVASYAAAAVLIPGRASNQLGDTIGQEQAGVVILADQAQRQATYTAIDGTIYELWIAPDTAGGTCRTVTSSKEPLDSDQWATVCTSTPFGSSIASINAVQTFVIGDHIGVTGSAPGATAVAIEIQGVVTKVPVSKNEYFAVRDEPCALDQRSDCLSNIRVTSYDTNGETLDTFGH